MIDVVHGAVTVLDVDQHLQHVEDVRCLALLFHQPLGLLFLALAEELVVIQHAWAKDFLATHAAVELHAADAGQVVAVKGKEQVEEQVLRRILGRRLARAHHAIDFHQRLQRRLGVVDTQGVRNISAAIEVVHVQRGHRLDAGLAEILQLFGGDLVVRRGQQLAGLAVDDIGGHDAPDRIVVRHFQRRDVLGRQLAHVARSDALAGFHQHVATNRQIEAQRLAAQALGDQLQRGATLLAEVEHIVLEEDAQHLLVVVAERAQQHRHRQLAATVDAGEQRVLRIELEVQPRAAVGDHARREQQLAGAVRLAAIVIKEHTRRTMQLRDDHPLGAVDDEGAGVGHERNLAHVDLLLLDVLDHFLRGRAFLVVDHQAHGGAQWRAVSHAAIAAFTLVERRLAEAIVDILESRIARIAGDRKNRLQRRMQTLVAALFGRHVLLQEFPVGIGLDSQQVGHAQDGGPLAKILADAFLLGKRVGHDR